MNSKTPKDTNPINPENPSVNNGIGLALGSGLARGFAHIGVLKTLNKHGIYPSIIAGTSIGAVVGGSYLAGKLDTLEDWATHLNRLRIFSYMDFKMKSPGLIGGDKLENVLKKHLDGINIEDLPTPFVALASDLGTGHEVWLQKGSLIKAMRASFALPGVFPPVKHKHRQLVDGAMVNPVPVSVCRALGADMIIAVDLHADLIGKATAPGKNYQRVAGFDVYNDKHVSKSHQRRFFGNLFAKRLFGRKDGESPSLFGVMVSALSIIQDRITRSRLAGDPPDVHIKPHVGHIGMVEFECAEELIALGEEAAERAIPKIKAAMQVLLHPDHRPNDKETHHI